MRVLVVADDYPWPVVGGYRHRLSGIVRALTHEAEVNLVCFPESDLVEPVPQDAGIHRSAVVPAEGSKAGLLRWPLGRAPRSTLWRDWSTARQFLADWGTGGYDVVWFNRLSPYLALADLYDVPLVVDYDDLVSSVLRYRRDVLKRSGGSVLEQARNRARALADAIDSRRWHRIEQAEARRAAAVLVCSEVDRRRLGSPNGFVVPNGYELGGPLAGTARREPTFLLVGSPAYEPNLDAAHFFAEDVLPLIRERLPAARLRVVGGYDSPAQVARLAAAENVDVVGLVDDIRDDLARADVSVVPIRFGGGTRIKILEAFAYRIPVVSTSVGCEGIEAKAGTHLLVADDAAGFADACVNAYQDSEERAALVEAGRALWSEKYRWSVIGERVAEAVHFAAGR